MASIPGFRFDISGASGSGGFLGPKESWRAFVFPRGGYAAQDSVGTLVTFDSAAVASRFSVGNWIQAGIQVANIRQVGAVGGNSLSVTGSALTVSENTRIFLIGNTEPTVVGGSATYTTPNTLIRQRDDSAADLYTNSMITTNSDGLAQGFADLPAYYDVMVQDGNHANQGNIIDMEVGTVSGISASDAAFFGDSVTIAGNVIVGGTVTVGGNFTAKIGPWKVLDCSQFASGSSTGGLQEAHDSLTALGGAIAIPAGYTISYVAITTISKPVMIFGHGDSSLLVNADGTGLDCFRVTGTTASFRRFKINGQKASRTNGRGFSLAGATGTTIEDVTIADTPDAAIGTNLSSVAGAHLRILNNRIFNPGDAGSTDPYGIILNNTTEALVEGNLIVGATSAGIFGFNGAHRVRIATNRVIGCENGIRWGSTSSFPLCDGWTVIGNQVSGCSTDGIRADGSSATVIGNASWGNGNSGIKMDGPTARAIIQGNRCSGNVNKGIYVNNANGNIADILIRDNICEGNTGNGIRIDPSFTSNPMLNISVCDNQLMNNLDNGLQITAHAGGTGSISIHGNVYRGNSAAEVFGSSGWTYDFTPPSKRGSDIAAAATLTIPTDGSYFYVTGSTSTATGISWNTWDNGRTAKLIVATGLTISDSSTVQLAGTFSGVTNGSIVIRGVSGAWNEDCRSVN